MVPPSGTSALACSPGVVASASTWLTTPPPQLVPRRGPVAQRERWSAARYLLEADAAVPVPLETACLLANLNPAWVRAVTRLYLR